MMNFTYNYHVKNPPRPSEHLFILYPKSQYFLRITLIARQHRQLLESLTKSKEIPEKSRKNAIACKFNPYMN